MNQTLFKNCKAVFFDLYGTLLDYNDHQTGNEIWLNTFNTLVGIPKNLSFEILTDICEKILSNQFIPTKEESLTTYESKIKYYFEKQNVFFSNDELKNIANKTVGRWQENITLSSDSISVLTALKEKYRLALISNFDHTPHVKNVITTHKLDSFLNPIIISDEVGYTKPDARIFQLALAQTNLNANQVIYVGDSYADDVLGARAANILPVMIKHKNSSHLHNSNNGDESLIMINYLSELLELLS